jgi:processing peptidase subunit alpha
MVVAGVGVDHNVLVESVQKYFVDMKPVWEEDPDLVMPARNMPVDKSIAQYTGGMVQVRLLTPRVLLETLMLKYSHIVIHCPIVHVRVFPQSKRMPYLPQG